MAITKKRRSQVTIFVIIAIILVAIIAGAFILYNKNYYPTKIAENPQVYIAECIKSSLENTEKLILDSNLYPNMEDNYFVYKSEKVKYLCKASSFYFPCINQEPMIIGKVKKDIENYVRPEAEKCLSDLKQIFIKKGYKINESIAVFEVKILPGKIIFEVNKKMIISKNEEVRIFENFNSEINSPLYTFLETLRSIINYESATCEFNDLNWMLVFPKVKIDKFMAGESTKVYTLTDRNTNKKINFAIKDCALPAGI